MEDVTAKWARNIAEMQLVISAKAQVETCLNAIKEAANKKRFTVTVGLNLEDMAKTELLRRGFKVEEHDDQRDGSWVVINW